MDRTKRTWGLALVALFSIHCGDGGTASPSASDAGCPGEAPANAYGIHAYPPDALPSGACAGAGTVCELETQQVCDDRGFMGPQATWECACTNATWTCTRKSATASICPPPDAGGADAH